jgi:hypothetical protein
MSIKKDILTFVESFRKEREKPETIKAGQIWTIFKPRKKRGTMILVLETSNTNVRIIPLHVNSIFRTGIDRTIQIPETPINLIACVTNDIMVGVEAFSRSRFVSKISLESVEDITDSVNKCNRMLLKLGLFQLIESQRTPTDKEIQELFCCGVLDLVAPHVSFEKFTQFERELLGPLYYWQKRFIDL